MDRNVSESAVLAVRNPLEIKHDGRPDESTILVIARASYPKRILVRPKLSSDLEVIDILRCLERLIESRSARGPSSAVDCVSQDSVSDRSDFRSRRVKERHWRPLAIRIVI